MAKRKFQNGAKLPSLPVGNSFGKTFAMNMLQTFFGKTKDEGGNHHPLSFVLCPLS